MSSIHIYWDESHFWGLLVQRALQSWKVPHRLVRATEIAQSLESGKPAALIVPGGRAKGKADRLGPEGKEAIRSYVRAGGTYIGFCGGAGLALDEPTGLGLVPWKRKRFSDRLQHFLSGHIRSELKQPHALVPEALGNEALLPVWWPGQFEPQENGCEVLATYREPGPDVYVADLNLKSLPKGTMSDWEALYGIQIRPDFIKDRPCVIQNAYGDGQVVLSYAHLETPASPQANQWLSHILCHATGHCFDSVPVPAWNLSERPVLWDDPTLAAARATLESIIETGRTNFLLFWRNPWLLGWRRGIPGSALNSLYALVCESQSIEPTDNVIKFWLEVADEFHNAMQLFGRGVTGYLLAERLAMTVFHSANPALDHQTLKRQKESLFGHPPTPGGMYASLLHRLEDLYWLLASDQ